MAALRTLAVGAACASLLLPAAAPARTERGWQPIFDGKSLRGWTPKITGQPLGVDPLRTFRVVDGAIRVSYDRYGKFGGRFGHLAYKRPLGAFRLRFEYRFLGRPLPDVEPWQHANSGAMVLGQPPATMSRDQKFPVSLEVQLLGADGPEARPTGNLCTPGTNVVIDGRLETEHCIRSASPTFPNGRWVEAEIEIGRDGAVVHRIEGRPVLAYRGAQFDPADPDAKPLITAAGGRLGIDRGYLYLQSEGHSVEFRNLALKVLD